MFNWINKLRFWQKPSEVKLEPLVMPKPNIWEEILGKTERELKDELDNFDWSMDAPIDQLMKPMRYRHLRCDYDNVKMINDGNRIRAQYGEKFEREYTRAMFSA